MKRSFSKFFYTTPWVCFCHFSFVKEYKRTNWEARDTFSCVQENNFIFYFSLIKCNQLMFIIKAGGMFYIYKNTISTNEMNLSQGNFLFNSVMLIELTFLWESIREVSSAAIWFAWPLLIINERLAPIRCCCCCYS